MKTEIKFRGLTATGEWAYGTYHYSLDNKRHYILNREKFILNKEHFYLHDKEVCFVSPESVGQFIGVNDKHNKNIYNGDLIKIYWDVNDPTIEEISYDDNHGYWKYGNNPICELTEIHNNFEVIGNIYENPNLLTNGI